MGMATIPPEYILILVITITERPHVEYRQLERMRRGMDAPMRMETRTRTNPTRARINSVTHGSIEWVVQTATKMESLMVTTLILKTPQLRLMTMMETV